MKLPGNFENIEDLLTVYFAGSASPEQAMAVEEWLESDAKNKKLYNQYAELWHGVTGENFTAGSKNEVWKTLNRQLSKKRVVVYPKYKLFAAAAALIIFLIVYTAIHMNVRDNNNTPEVKISPKNLVSYKLPDKSIITILPGSLLMYQPGNYFKKRALRFNGEAYFDVTHNSTLPCIISVGSINLKILGTTFSISTQNPGIIEIQLNNGIIKAYNTSDSVIIYSGQVERYLEKEKRFLPVDAINPNTFAYATRNFNFKNENLFTISQYLHKAFGLNFEFENTMLRNCRMSGEFTNQSLRYILDVIAITLNVKYTIKNDTVYFSGAGCN